MEDNNEVTEDILDLSDHAKRKMHGYRQHGVTPANKNKWFHGVTADTENGFDGEGLDLPPDMSMGQNPQIGYPYSPIVHGPKWFPSKVNFIFYSITCPSTRINTWHIRPLSESKGLNFGSNHIINKNAKRCTFAAMSGALH